MKKISISFCLIFFMSICAHAQLRITNDGNAAVGETGANPNAQLTSFKEGTDTIIGLLGIARSNSYTTSVVGNSIHNRVLGKSIGVKGIAGGGTGPYNYGVWGQLHTQASGAAVAGFINDVSFSPSSSRYAGLFNGAVKVIGTITATNVVTSSDQRLKTGVAKIDMDAVNSLSLLSPVQYYWDPIQYSKCVYGHEENTDEIIDNKLHYGFIAQELREIFPDLVYGNEDEGTLSVNYMELIPLLVQSIQELSAEIQELQGKGMRKAPALGGELESEISAMLFQNTPNPFSQATMIKYQLPHSVQSAYIYVYDMSGKQMGEYILNERGEGQLTISASEYHAGMYLYSLIADGQEIDTKRMILTK